MSLTTMQLVRPADAPVCLPRYATARNLERQTLGPRVAKVAELCGYELMPWQRQVLDVALEIDPKTGRLVYREVRLTVPRQSGKTTLLLSLMTHRCIGFGERQRVVFTMQTRQDARAKLFEDYKPVLEASPLGERLHFREGNGHERISFPNGSLWGLTSSGEKSGHGPTVDLGVLDEAFAQEDDRFEQALKPSMITRGSAQFWVVSTMGTNASTYFNHKVDAGRLAAEQGLDEGVAYFEWSAGEDEDPASHDTWFRCMPALGITVPVEAVQADFNSMKLDEFKRAYLNIKHDKGKAAEWKVISEAQYLDALDLDGRISPNSKLTFGVDVSPDRSRAAIAVAGDRKGGGVQVEVVEAQGGVSWVVERLHRTFIKQGRRFDTVAIDPKSGAASMIDELALKGVPVTQVKMDAHARYAAGVFDGFSEGGLWHRGQVELTDAVAGARKRTYGDQWLWDRRTPSTDITPLVAATLAHGTHLSADAGQGDSAPIFAY